MKSNQLDPPIQMHKGAEILTWAHVESPYTTTTEVVELGIDEHVTGRPRVWLQMDRDGTLALAERLLLAVEWIDQNVEDES